MHHLIRQTAIILLVCLGSLAISGTSAAKAPVQNSYRVEMIVFANNDPNNFTQEEWPQKLPAPDVSKAVALFDGQQATGFSALPPKDYALDAEANRLQASGRYTVLAHVAWEQPGLSISQAIPVAITAGRDYASDYPALTTTRYMTEKGQAIAIPAPQHLYRLSGTIKVVLGRYLHVYTDLLLNVPSQPFIGKGGLTRQVEDTAVIDNPSALPAPGGTLTAVHMIQQRRTRSRVLNYMDHPLLGILFEIWPIGNSR